jgi:cell shape-determining protein MreC
MSKALQSHISPNENDSHSIDSPTLSNYQQHDRHSLDNQTFNSNPLKKFQNDIDVLKELLDKKELLIIELTKTSREERLKFEQEKFQLNQKIEQLQNENIKLQKQLNIQ